MVMGIGDVRPLAFEGRGLLNIFNSSSIGISVQNCLNTTGTQASSEQTQTNSDS